MFKSIENYSFTKNKTGVTITGPGVVTITVKDGNYSNADCGRLDIDDCTNLYPSQGSIFLFKEKCRLYTDNNSYAKISATVGLFN